MKTVVEVRVDVDEDGVTVTVEYGDGETKQVQAPPGSEIVVRGAFGDPVAVSVDKPMTTPTPAPGESE